jgi:hypothetical protein
LTARAAPKSAPSLAQSRARAWPPPPASRTSSTDAVRKSRFSSQAARSLCSS